MNVQCQPSCEFYLLTEDTRILTLAGELASMCKKEGELLFDITLNSAKKSNLPALEEVMKSNNIKSQLAGNPSLALDNDSIANLCKEVGKRDLSYVFVTIGNDKATVYNRKLSVTFSDQIAAFGKT